MILGIPLNLQLSSSNAATGHRLIKKKKKHIDPLIHVQICACALNNKFFLHAAFIKQCIIQTSNIISKMKVSVKWQFNEFSLVQQKEQVIIMSFSLTQNLVWKCTQLQLITGEKQNRSVEKREKGHGEAQLISAGITSISHFISHSHQRGFRYAVFHSWMNDEFLLIFLKKFSVDCMSFFWEPDHYLNPS